MEKYVVNRIDGKVASVQSVKSLIGKTHNGQTIDEAEIDKRIAEINADNQHSHYEYWSVENSDADIIDFLLGENGYKVGKEISDLYYELRELSDQADGVKYALDDIRQTFEDFRDRIKEIEKHVESLNTEE